jgi:hypothetical protein
MINRYPQAKRGPMIERIVPARTNDFTSRRAQYRLIRQAQVIAIMTVITAYTRTTTRKRGIVPTSAIIAHEHIIRCIPGLVMIEKRGGPL